MIPRLVIDLTCLNGTYGLGVETFAQGLTVGLSKHLSQDNVKILCSKEGEKWVRDFFINDESNRQLEIITIVPNFPFILNKILAMAYRGLLPLFLVEFLENLKWLKLKSHYKGSNVVVPSTYINVTFGQRTLVCLHDCQETTFPKFFNSRQLRYRRIKLRTTLKKAWKIQVSSTFVKVELSKLPNYEQSKIVLVPEGVDTSQFTFKPYINAPNSTLKILVPGSFLPHKNHFLLIPTLRAVLNNIDLIFLITGTENKRSRAFRDSLSEIEREHVKFLGFIPRQDLIEYYQNSDVVLSTSLYESSSLPLLEGYASGCKVIATSIPAHQEMSEIIPDIYLFDPYSPSQLSSILRTIAQDKMSGKLERKVEKKVLEKIDWKARARLYLDIFPN